MKICTFCSKEVPLLVNHPVHNIGFLCIDCYLKLHGGVCGACNTSLLPPELKPDITYRTKEKFISMGEKSFLVCEDCFEVIRQKFPQIFA